MRLQYGAEIAERLGIFGHMFESVPIGAFGFFRAIQRQQRDAEIVMGEGAGGIELERALCGNDDRPVTAQLDQRGVQSVENQALSGYEFECRLKRRHFLLDASGRAAGIE